MTIACVSIMTVIDTDYFKGICSDPLIHTETNQMHPKTL